MTIANGIDVSSDQLAELCRRFGVTELSVFGSAARGEMRDDSDIDLLVEFDSRANIGLEFFALEMELANLFARKLDLGTKTSLKPRVRASALPDARILYPA